MMNSEEIFDRIKSVFEEFFADDHVVITKETTMANLDEWESVAHIQLIFEIEEAFDIQFEAEEIANLDTIMKIIDSIEKNNI